MPTYPLKDYQQTVGAGLGTWTYTVPTAGPYSVSCFSTFNAPSGLIITINQNGSAVGPTPTSSLPASSGEVNVKALIDCAASDVITVVLTSTLSPDPTSNTIKSCITLTPGF